MHDNLLLATVGGRRDSITPRRPGKERLEGKERVGFQTEERCGSEVRKGD